MTPHGGGDDLVKRVPDPMAGLQVLVVDDEPLARERLARLLAEAGCEIAGQYGNAFELLERLRAGGPVDAIFLDIRMPGLSGLEVAAGVQDLPPVVFVTAYAEYAVDAFDLSAVDYLTKPVFRERLDRCLAKLREHQVRRLDLVELRHLLKRRTRFPILAGGGEVYLELDLVTHFETQGERVWACVGAERFLTRWTALSQVEQAFPQEAMLRIRRNLLLRPGMVRGCRPAFGGRIQVLVAPKVELPVSRAMTPQTRERLRTPECI